MDLLQRLTDAIAPPTDDEPPPPASRTVLYLHPRPLRAAELPPDRLLPAEIAALRQALTSCPILRRIVESSQG